MHYLLSRNTYFSTMYHMSVYDVTYKTLGHTNLIIYTAVDVVEYIPYKQGVYLERNFSLTLSSINP